MPLSDLRALLGPPARYRIDCPDAPDYFDEVVVGARWKCGCTGQGQRFAELTLTPCPSHAEAVVALRFHNANGAFGAQAS